MDIRSEELYGDDECGFRLTFDFLENGHFDNTVLVSRISASRILFLYLDHTVLL